MKYKNQIIGIMKSHINLIEHCQSLMPVIERSIAIINHTIRSGGVVYWYGNGGSAADAQHMAAELVSRFKKERRAFASVALTTDTSVLTAIGNDYGFDNIFQRQVEGLVKKGDVCIGLSTSANSQNIYNAHKKAQHQGAKTISLLGNCGGIIKNVSDSSIVVPSEDTPRIQEAHTLLAHIICEMVENTFAQVSANEEEYVCT